MEMTPPTTPDLGDIRSTEVRDIYAEEVPDTHSEEASTVPKPAASVPIIIPDGDVPTVSQQPLTANQPPSASLLLPVPAALPDPPRLMAPPVTRARTPRQPSPIDLDDGNPSPEYQPPTDGDNSNDGIPAESFDRTMPQDSRVTNKMYPAPAAYDDVDFSDNPGLFADAPWLDREALADAELMAKYATDGWLPGSIPLGAENPSLA